MAIVKIKVENYHHLDKLRAVKNQPIMFDRAKVIMFTDVKVVTEQETYGRKNNKVHDVKYLYCQCYGYNNDGEFLGTYDEEFIRRILLMYDLLKMRRIYLDFLKQLESIQALEAKLNEPDIVKAIPE